MTTAVVEKTEKPKPKPAKKPEKKKDDVLEVAIAALHQKEGKDSLSVGLNSGVVKCEVFSTRCLPLDLALGVGGIPRSRITEIFGPESCGKTTIASTIVAEAQAMGEVACYLDNENAIDPEYMGNLGVNLDKLLFSQPDSGEQTFRIIDKLLDTNKVGIIVVDSVAALVTEAELAGEIGDQFVAEQARLMSLNLRKLTGKIRRSRCALVFINQLREKTHTMPGQSPNTTPGGRALKFYASVRIDACRIGSVKEGPKGAEVSVANTTRVKIVKNKVAPPFKQAVFDIRFGEGIDTISAILDMAILHKLVEKSGGNHSYNGEKIGASRKETVGWLKENSATTLALDSQLRETLFSKIIEGASVPTINPEVADPTTGDEVEGEEAGISSEG